MLAKELDKGFQMEKVYKGIRESNLEDLLNHSRIKACPITEIRRISQKGYHNQSRQQTFKARLSK